MPNAPTPTLLSLTAQIVAAHLRRTPLPAASLPGLIGRVHAALAGAARPQAAAKPSEPAAPQRRTVFPDYLICLEDGRKLKTLKRHLRTNYDLTPEAYREKWGLPADHPMVAPNYAAQRSKLAKQLGLGRRAAPPAAAAPPPAPEPVPPSLSAAEVFARFPTADAAPDIEETQAVPAALQPRKRQPFAQQRTRTMPASPAGRNLPES